jgi:tRNA-dihydrouridine synthase
MSENGYVSYASPSTLAGMMAATESTYAIIAASLREYDIMVNRVVNEKGSYDPSENPVGHAVDKARDHIIKALIYISRAQEAQRNAVAEAELLGVGGTPEPTLAQ